MIVNENEIIEGYGIYIESEECDGYVHLEFGQGEEICYLSEDFDDIEWFGSREEALETALVNFSCINIESIQYFKKEIVTTVKIFKEKSCEVRTYEEL